MRSLSKIRIKVFLQCQISINFSKVVGQKALTLEQSQYLLGRPGTNTLKMGIVGMANVGKSSTFNLLSEQNVPAENFPFCTIDPNIAMVKVPDHRLDKLIDIYKPASIVGPAIQITDIAGLVKGAAEGEGLGNEFLSHIQAVDGIYHVVRAFEKDSIIHTEGCMDSLRDIEIINKELASKDLQFINKKLEEIQKKANRTQNPEVVEQKNVLEQVQILLKGGKWVRHNVIHQQLIDKIWTEKQIEILNKLLLLTSKPMLYLFNLSQKDFLNYQETQQDKRVNELSDWVIKNGGGSVIPYSVEYEESNKDLSTSMLNTIIKQGYHTLNLVHYFTVGHDEVRSWTIKRNEKAPQAAGMIHTDFEKGFVSAEVLHFDQFVQLYEKKGLDKIQKSFKKEGKDYLVKDGDIITFNCKLKR